MLATQRGERLSGNDEGVKKTGWGPTGFASARVSTETQNSGGNSPCGGDAGPMPELDVTLFGDVLMTH